MPRALPDGLYEHVITTALEHDLRALAQRQHSTRDLDRADSPAALARHVDDPAFARHLARQWLGLVEAGLVVEAT